MKITVTSTDVISKPWDKNGRSGVIRTQQAIAENATRRNPIRLDLGKDDAFPVGVYECDLEANMTWNQYGDMQLARKLVLQPVKSAARAVA